jgi:hypothetical protein
VRRGRRVELPRALRGIGPQPPDSRRAPGLGSAPAMRFGYRPARSLAQPDYHAAMTDERAPEDHSAILMARDPHPLTLRRFWACPVGAPAQVCAAVPRIGGVAARAVGFGRCGQHAAACCAGQLSKRPGCRDRMSCSPMSAARRTGERRARRVPGPAPGVLPPGRDRRGQRRYRRQFWGGVMSLFSR